MSQESAGMPGEEVPAMLMAGGRSRDPDAMKRLMSQASGGIPKPQIAYIGTASEDSLSFFQMMKLTLKKAGAGKVTLVRLAKEKPNLDAARQILAEADLIFISGGEVEDGMKWLIKHGLVPYLKELYAQGKRFIGVSAGVIMLGSLWVRWDKPEDDSTAQLFDCLGIIPALFDVHGEEEGWAELKTALRLMGDGARGYALPSGCAISADSQGALVNLEKEYLVFANEGGQIRMA